MLITGAGSLGPRRGVRLGHFTAERWQAKQPGALAEIFVGGEGLVRGARRVLATLLHEAAHGLAHKRGIKDTSRQGRYHNQRFKTIAEELGLEVEHHPSLGWSLTTLAASTARRYAPAIGARSSVDRAPSSRTSRSPHPARGHRLTARPPAFRSARLRLAAQNAGDNPQAQAVHFSTGAFPTRGQFSTGATGSILDRP